MAIGTLYLPLNATLEEVSVQNGYELRYLTPELLFDSLESTVSPEAIFSGLTAECYMQGLAKQRPKEKSLSLVKQPRHALCLKFSSLVLFNNSVISYR